MPGLRRLLVCLALAASPAFAGEIWVTRYDDPAPNGCLPTDCSLREAVIEANADPDFDSIRLSAGVYTLSIAGTNEQAAATGDLDLTSNLEIGGPAATMTAVTGGLDRIFEVRGAGVTAEINDLTVRGGASPVAGNGIGVVLGAELLLLGCEVRDNTDTGGGVHLTGASRATVRNSLLTNNGGGGLVLNQGSSAELENVTLTDDLLGEIQIHGADASVTCRHCTLRHVTSALLVNGANGGGTATFANSIVAGTCTSINGGSLASLGGNVESAGNTCGFGQGDDQPNVSAATLDLAALADNGGATRSRLPGAASPAVGGARDAESLNDDQRAGERPETDTDAGSLERDAARPATPLFHDGLEQGSPAAWVVSP